MAGGSSIRWESDPLFSAAEVVQDSADRMESLYRLLVHDWNLVHEENKDNKLLSSVQYHKRDLVTAVETTKWQLEDFERAVYFAASSDESGLRKNAISKHKQFIDAIREQILLVDKCLEEISTGDSNRSMQWTNMNEPDAVGLALFLSGSDSMNHHLQYNSENSIMKRFFDSTGTTDEIIEIEPEEVHLRVNDTRHLNHASNSSKDEKSWEFGSNHSEGPCSKSEGMWENGLKKSGGVLTCNTDIGKTKRKYLFANNNLIMYLSRLLNNFWFLNKRSFSRNFTKRRKDGEITDDIIVDIDGDGHTKNVSSAEQGLNFTGLASAMQVDKWLEALPRRFDRFQGVFRRITFDVRSAIVVLITVAILGLLVFSIA